MFYLDTITKAECYHNYPCYAYIVKGNNSILVYCTVCFSRSLTQCIYICILLIHNEKCTECFSNNVSHRFVMRIITIGHYVLSLLQIRNEECTECGKRFFEKADLQKHSRVHSKERPFKCDLCPMSFTQQNILKCHRRRHTGEKPYVCDICDRAFTQVRATRLSSLIGR